MKLPLAALSFVLLTGCPPPDQGTTPESGSGSGSAAKTAMAGDNAIEVPAYELKGVMFEPGALSRPGMPTTIPKGKPNLDKQRKLYASQKDPVLKQAYGAQLASMLYLEFKTEDGKAKTDAEHEDAKKKWLTEARQVLRDAATAAGEGKVDDLTLRMLGSYELLFDDYAGSEKAWSALVNKDPNGKEAAYNRAWWALSLLWQYKNAEALAVVKDQPLADKQPELAYAMAWARWRTGDEAGAWKALNVAAGAKAWTDQPTHDALERDILVFAGRTNTTFEAALPEVTAFAGKAKPLLYPMLAKLGLSSYGFAGRWAEGVKALEKALETAGDTVPPNDRVVIRYVEADYTVRLDAPVETAKFAKQAIEAIAACGTKCKDQEKQDYVTNIYGIGRLFHLLYATSNDVRYYGPAHDLYELTIPLLMDPARRAEAQKDAAALELTLKNTKVGTGKHDTQAIGVLLARHNQEAQACYETSLAMNPKLGGSVVVTLESDQTGVIKGVATEPKAGLADLSAVAGCIGEHAKTWKLPTRGQPGSTRIKLTYALSAAKK
ncbi:MAG: AgmX/PglI C-terminal domain-containing protein [Proteobacteria bacterium]|nr:AgmX/PglI C-terminal domain-containing protein [Pseudomonadota bacterium]